MSDGGMPRHGTLWHYLRGHVMECSGLLEQDSMH